MIHQLSQNFNRLRNYLFIFFSFFFFYAATLNGSVTVGVDVLFDEGLDSVLLAGKKIGLVSNHSAINRQCRTTLEVLNSRSKKYTLVALFAPEHGFYGDGYAEEKIGDSHLETIPIYSLHGETRRPTSEMLKKINVLIFDIQDIGSRSYTYISTLFYCMEEAAKQKIKVIVLDRPNPMGGEIIDGPLLDPRCRSFIGYINVPYCHGMTIGELATFFNHEYAVGCDLEIIPMRGWKRWMTFKDTGLIWIPTSPQIPEMDTVFFYPTTGLIGQCSLASIGIGYTLPFKIVGAPWINGELFAKKMNDQNLPGVHFQQFHFRPFFGKFKQEKCQGVRIIITDTKKYLPFSTQYALLSMIKNLYPEKFEKIFQELLKASSQKDIFSKLNGNPEILKIMTEERYFFWKLKDLFKQDREKFIPIRNKYLNPAYSS